MANYNSAMTMHADVIVVGAGGVGSAALFHLAQRGARVLGIDRFPAGHDRGSSHGHSRIIRLAYFEHPDYVPLLRRSYALWAELEQAQGEQLYLQTGLLEVGAPEGPTIQGILAAARTHQLEVEQLTHSECRHRFPGVLVPSDCAAIFESQAGVLRVERCVLAHLDQARRWGANVIAGETVVGWTARNDVVEVTTDKATYRAQRLVLTAGPWAGALLAPFGVPLPVRRKHIHWYPGPAECYAAEHGCPAFLYETPGGDFYGIPAFDGHGLKAGEHTGGAAVTDPLTDERGVDADDRRRVEAFLDVHLPHVGRPALEHCTCFYTMSPDCHFLVDRHPEHANVAFAAGLSGHGFKFTGVLGEALADLALTGRTELPIGFLSVARFTGLAPTR
jgi:sarcosine oxidase